MDAVSIRDWMNTSYIINYIFASTDDKYYSVGKGDTATDFATNSIEDTQ